jgi:hypothetical protein
MAAHLSRRYARRQRPRLPQCLHGAFTSHGNQLLHRVSGHRRHHGRHLGHAVRCVQRGKGEYDSCCVINGVFVLPTLPDFPNYRRGNFCALVDVILIIVIKIIITGSINVINIYGGLHSHHKHKTALSVYNNLITCTVIRM